MSWTTLLAMLTAASASMLKGSDGYGQYSLSRCSFRTMGTTGWVLGTSELGQPQGKGTTQYHDSLRLRRVGNSSGNHTDIHN